MVVYNEINDTKIYREGNNKVEKLLEIWANKGSTINCLLHCNLYTSIPYIWNLLSYQLIVTIDSWGYHGRNPGHMKELEESYG